MTNIYEILTLAGEMGDDVAAALAQIKRLNRDMTDGEWAAALTTLRGAVQGIEVNLELVKSECKR